MSLRKKIGFNGQRTIVLPKKVIKTCEQYPIISTLYITDIGYYPKAQYHYCERNNGAHQNILIYCIDGAGWVKIEGKRINISQGQYLIIPKDIKHVYSADDELPWSIYWVHFSGSLGTVIATLLKKDKDSFVNTISFQDKSIALFNEIYKTFELGYSVNNLHYINMTFWKFLATFCYPDLLHIDNKIMDDEIDIVVKYMQENLHQEITLHSLAEHVHMSASHFSAVFKKKTGYPPLEYFNQIKIQKACQYLEFTDIHVKELSYNLGFNDPFYFSRLFKKFMGLSPIEFRKKMKFSPRIMGSIAI